MAKETVGELLEKRRTALVDYCLGSIQRGSAL